MRSKNKENIIVLPNGDECPVGKTKDESKMLNVVSVEYGLEREIRFFRLQKEKNKYFLRLEFIPSGIGQLQSINGRRFALFELIRTGINCVVRPDGDLNKRCSAILDLVNNQHPNSKETVRAKLSAILDESGQLDELLEQLLTDAQFNSVKFSVLNNKKMTCLLCVNSSGLFTRSLETFLDVQESVQWTDVKEVSCKQKRLMVHLNSGQVSEISCLTSKVARQAHHHLRRYLQFLGSSVPQEPTSWFGRLSMRIRRSFSRRSDARCSSSQQSGGATLTQPAASCTSIQQKSLAPSTIPESSFISEDVLDNNISVVEPSLKTNSTYDVSLGSDNSYRPAVQSLSIEESAVSATAAGPLLQKAPPVPPSVEQPCFNYELGPDTPIQKSDPPAPLSSFGASSGTLSGPPSIQVKKDVVLNEKEKSFSRPLIVKPEEPMVTANEERQMVGTVTPTADTQRSKILPMVPVRSDSQPPLLDIRSQQSDQPPATLSNNVSVNDDEIPSVIAPDPPLRTVTMHDSANKMLPITIEPIKEEDIMSSPSGFDEPIQETVQELEAEICVLAVSETPIDTITDAIVLEQDDSIPPIIAQPHLQPDTPAIQAEHGDKSGITPTADDKDLRMPTDRSKEIAAEVIPTDSVDGTKEDPPEVVNANQSSNQETSSETVKHESKLPVSRQRSIPSPKIQRPNRVTSKGLPSPKEESNSFVSSIPVSISQSPSDKENFQNGKDVETNGSVTQPQPDSVSSDTVANFSRFENPECKVDSKTTITTVTTVGDNIVKKSTQTEISSMKYTGIPTPKQFKSTTTITTTVKKPADISKSPSSNSSTKIPTGIPRMSTSK